MNETPEPSAIEMRLHVSEDAKLKRYSLEVLKAIQNAIEGTADAYNEYPLYPVRFPVQEPVKV